MDSLIYLGYYIRSLYDTNVKVHLVTCIKAITQVIQIYTILV